MRKIIYRFMFHVNDKIFRFCRIENDRPQSKQSNQTVEMRSKVIRITQADYFHYGKIRFNGERKTAEQQILERNERRKFALQKIKQDASLVC